MFARDRTRIPLPAAALLVLLAFGAVGCSDRDARPVPATTSPGNGLATCDAPEDPCPPWSNPVTLEVERDPGGTSDPRNPVPQPHTAAAVYPGDRVDVRIEGFRAGDEAQVFSTLPELDGRSFRADNHGVVEFWVRIDDDAVPETHYVAVAQPSTQDERGPLAGFVLTVIDADASREIPWPDIIKLADGADLPGAD